LEKKGFSITGFRQVQIGMSPSMDRSWPFLLTSALLVLGLAVAGGFWVTTHDEIHDDAASPA
jgi:hypothetical protein